jgi:hypothetical protein
VSTDVHYERVIKRQVVDNGGVLALELTELRQPFEDVTIWVYPIGAGGYTLEHTLNGIVASTAAVAVEIPQKILIEGIFPHNAIERLENDQQSPKISYGVVPGVKVTNTGAKRTFVVSMTARVWGSAV